MKFTAPLAENHMFKVLYSRGKRAEGACMILYALARRRRFHDAAKYPAGGRLGLTVSKKMGCAVRRNRCRRRLKEAYRLCEQTVKPGFDIVIVARGRAYDAPFVSLQNELRLLLAKLSLLREEKL